MGGVNVWVKRAMVTFNFLFWVCGALILSITIWLQTAKGTSEIFGEGIYDINPHVAMNMLIVVGAVIMILGFLGCCGAVAENRFVLLAFFIGLLLILILQLSAGILAVSFRYQTEHILNDTFYENAALLTTTNDVGEEFQKAIAAFQQKFKCCGLINGPDDWGDNFKNNFKSCECPETSDLCISYQGKTVYKQPCVRFIKQIISRRVEIIIGLAFGLAVIEMFGLVFSLILYFQIGKK